MTGFVIVGAVGLAVMVGCFVAVIHTAHQEIFDLRERVKVLIERADQLEDLLHIRGTANEKLRERIKQLHWEKSEIWQWLTAPEEADHGTR